MIGTQGVHASREQAGALDTADPLAEERARFDLPPELIYLDGHSLGALPHGVAERIERTVGHEWGRGLVRSWNDPWIDLWRLAAGKIARLIGARAEDVAVADSVSVNLFKALAAALALRSGRRAVLVAAGEFPTDVYVAEGLCEQLGARVEIRRVSGDLTAALDDGVAVVLASHASYLTGALTDMAAVTAAAHAAGALTVWDLSHSVGAVAVDVTGTDADFAIGCGYKYLNGGPGAPSFLYLAPRLQDAARTPIQGWLGHQDFFAFEGSYRPAAGIARFQCGTWPVLSLTALDNALDAFDGVAPAALEEKARALTTLFIDCLEPLLGRHPLSLATPRDPQRRGAQVSVRHADGYAVLQALAEHGVLGDFREPDVMRFGLAPLYVRFTDVWDAVDALAQVLDSGAYHAPHLAKRARIT